MPGISKFTLYKYVKVDSAWRYCKAACRIDGFPSTMGNLLLEIWRDSLGGLRKSASRSKRGTLVE